MEKMKLMRVLVLGFVVGCFAQPSSATTCYGTLYEYFSDATYTYQTTSKVECPGYATQYDEPFAATPYYTTQSVVCPCPPGSGGGGGDPETEDTEAPPEE